MAKLEECVRSVQADGLLWGASKLLPVGYGIRKLQINCVVEDDKVGTDMLEEEITKFEDYVSMHRRPQQRTSLLEPSTVVITNMIAALFYFNAFSRKYYTDVIQMITRYAYYNLAALPQKF